MAISDLPRYGRSRRPRDSQRSRLYKAQWEIGAGHNFKTIPALREYVSAILRHDWWRYYFPHVPDVTVKDGRGRKNAGAHTTTDGPTILMPRWSRTERVTLHELAHLVTPDAAPAHGPKFARLYVCIVTEYMGHQAGQGLINAYLKHGVRYDR